MKQHALEPRNGFEWSRVVWGGSHDRPDDHCSYCRRSLDEDERDYIALRLMGTSHFAVFCDDCMRTYWGMENP